MTEPTPIYTSLVAAWRALRDDLLELEMVATVADLEWLWGDE